MIGFNFSKKALFISIILCAMAMLFSGAEAEATGGVGISYDSPSIIKDDWSKPITLTATVAGGSGEYVYAFWLMTSDGMWHNLVKFSDRNTSNTYELDLNGYKVDGRLAPGPYRVAVFVNRNEDLTYVGSKGLILRVVSYDLEVTPDAASNVFNYFDDPSVTFTATPKGGTGPYLFEYHLMTPYHGWKMVSEGFISDSTYTLDFPRPEPGSYMLAVFAKEQDSNYEFEAIEHYYFRQVIYDVALYQDPPSNVIEYRPGAALTFTAEAYGGGTGTYVYRFDFMANDGSWSTVKHYNLGKTFEVALDGALVNAEAGTYRVAVFAKSDTSDAEFEAISGKSFHVVLPPEMVAEQMAEEILELVDSGEIAPKDASKLISFLDIAISRFIQGNENTADNKLNAFINKVQSLTNSGNISESVAAGLTDSATELIAR